LTHLVKKDFKAFDKVLPINDDTITFIAPWAWGELADKAQYQHEYKSIKAFEKYQFERAQ
jgi:hypothetical protein